MTDIVVKELIYVEDKDILYNIENIIETLNEIKDAIEEMDKRVQSALDDLDKRVKALEE